MRVSITEWIKSGIGAVVFLLFFKWIAGKSNVPALTAIAGKV